MKDTNKYYFYKSNNWLKMHGYPMRRIARTSNKSMKYIKKMYFGKHRRKLKKYNNCGWTWIGEMYPGICYLPDLNMHIRSAFIGGNYAYGAYSIINPYNIACICR